MIEEYERRIQEAKVLAQEERARIRHEGLEREREIVDKAREEAARFLAQVKADLEGQAETIIQHFHRESKAMVEEMVTRILGRKVA